MIVQRLRPGVKIDPYSGLPAGEDWDSPEVTELPGHLVGWQPSSEDPTVNRDELASQARLVRPGNVPQIEVLRTDRVRALGHDWDVASHPMTEEYADLLGVGLIAGPDAGTTWNLTLREG
ncbi:MAG: hypothetical protein QM804_10315 [Propionicimonas sp.]